MGNPSIRKPLTQSTFSRGLHSVGAFWLSNTGISHPDVLYCNVCLLIVGSEMVVLGLDWTYHAHQFIFSFSF